MSCINNRLHCSLKCLSLHLCCAAPLLLFPFCAPAFSFLFLVFSKSWRDCRGGGKEPASEDWNQRSNAKKPSTRPQRPQRALTAFPVAVSGLPHRSIGSRKMSSIFNSGNTEDILSMQYRSTLISSVDRDSNENAASAISWWCISVRFKS